MLFEKIKSIVGDVAQLDYVCTFQFGNVEQISFAVKTPNYRGVIVMAQRKPNEYFFSFSAMESNEVDVRVLKLHEIKDFMLNIGVVEKPHRAPQYDPLPVGVVGQ